MIEEFEQMKEAYDKNKTETKRNVYDLENIHGKVDWVDFPYIGIGEKPCKGKYLTDEQLENIIGG